MLLEDQAPHVVCRPAVKAIDGRRLRCVREPGSRVGVDSLWSEEVVTSGRFFFFFFFFLPVA